MQLSLNQELQMQEQSKRERNADLAVRFVGGDSSKQREEEKRARGRGDRALRVIFFCGWVNMGKRIAAEQKGNSGKNKGGASATLPSK